MAYTCGQWASRLQASGPVSRNGSGRSLLTRYERSDSCKKDHADRVVTPRSYPDMAPVCPVCCVALSRLKQREDATATFGPTLLLAPPQTSRESPLGPQQQALALMAAPRRLTRSLAAAQATAPADLQAAGETMDERVYSDPLPEGASAELPLDVGAVGPAPPFTSRSASLQPAGRPMGRPKACPLQGFSKIRRKI